MKQVMMMYLKSCPYCRQAFTMMEELKKEYPAYAKVNITLIEEREQKEIADKLDYYYVPSYYVGNELLHEGVPTKESLQNVLQKALDSE